MIQNGVIGFAANPSATLKATQSEPKVTSSDYSAMYSIPPIPDTYSTTANLGIPLSENLTGADMRVGDDTVQSLNKDIWSRPS